jgi:hypothetical protein
MEVRREGFAISSGGFEAGVHAHDFVLREPGGELSVAGRRVGKDLVAELAAVTRKAGVELEFRDVDAERGESHRSSSLRVVYLRLADLVDASSASWEAA